jgi:hypothetical protein
MRFIINIGQMLEVKMGVYLCGTNIAMTEQLLYGSQILAGFEQVAGKRMPQHVGMNRFVYTFFFAPQFQSQFDTASPQPGAAC